MEFSKLHAYNKFGEIGLGEMGFHIATEIETLPAREMVAQTDALIIGLFLPLGFLPHLAVEINA